jgi:formate dehydrogenase major subunit
VFFFPAAGQAEKEGCFTNTQRLLQWHQKAVDPPGDARSEAWFVYHLGRRLKERAARDTSPRNAGLRALTWDYGTSGPHHEPDMEQVLQEINGRSLADRSQLPGFHALASDGSTACGCWIYSGVYPSQGRNRANERDPHGPYGHGWGFSWPADRRILYNRASAAPDGTPWSERKKLVWWDDDARRWVGDDIPDFPDDLPPDHVPPPDAVGAAALRGDDAFVLQADGKAWLFAPNGVVDGPMPTHYEPDESPVRNPLRGPRASPTRRRYDHPDNPANPALGAVFPFVLTSSRLTEHYTSGAMTRTLPFLAELQPELFVEVSPQLAAERGLVHGQWCHVVTTRAAVQARAVVTERIPPLRVRGEVVHQVWMPYHFGRNGLAKGDVMNDLLGIVADPNVGIQEGKAATCDVRPGPRPTGKALLDYVADYRRRAGIA